MVKSRTRELPRDLNSESCGPLGRLLNLSVLQLPHLQSGNNTVTNSMHLTGPPWVLDK